MKARYSVLVHGDTKSQFLSVSNDFVAFQCIPGPGKYDVKGEFDKKRLEVEMSADIEHPPFGVQARVLQH